jgi:DNA-binding NarL/FixJ family response regulator
MRVIVVDDTNVYRLALAFALAPDPSIETIETAANAGAALDLLGDTAAGTVVLLNVSMRDGMASLTAIRCAVPETPVVALAVSDLDEEIIACVEAGVAGCLLKGDTYADLLALIASMARGETWCSPRVAAALLRRVARPSTGARIEPTDTRLTAREREVMQLVDEGLSNKQIARKLSIELRTVKNHVHHILVKYQVHRRADAIALFRAVQHSGGRATVRPDPDVVSAH